MSATGWISAWATWQKSPNTEGGATDKTDTTAVEAKKSPNEGGGGTDKTDKTSLCGTALDGQKSAKEGGGATDNTDKTAVEAQKSPKEGGGATDNTDKTPLLLLPPCAVCGGETRWNDHGVQRCLACWPTPLTRHTLTAEQREQTRRRHHEGAEHA